MVILRTLLMVLLLSVVALPSDAATHAETQAYSTAAQAYEDRVWWLAESGFAQFVVNFPKSERRAEAILYQGISRLQQTNSIGAIDLLQAGLEQAGPLADEYQYWIAEANFQTANYGVAANAYTELRRRYAASKRKLDAYVGEAISRARLNQWTQIVALLGDQNGEFMRAASSSTNDVAARGLITLAEAQLAQTNYAAVQTAVASLRSRTNSGIWGWRAEYLCCEAQLKSGRLSDALVTSSNLISRAAAASEGKENLLAESVVLQGGIYERLGQGDKALAAYERNLKSGVSEERQRQALLKTTELALAQGNLTGATNALVRFLNQFTNAPASDVALLSLGEIQLKQSPTGATFNTNIIDTALGNFDRLLKDFPATAYGGRAELDRGWCFWLKNQMPESAAAFERAIQRLGDTEDRLVARFKLGDTLFEQKEFTRALEQYREAANALGRWPRAREQLSEDIYYQMLRAGLALTNEAAATEAMDKIRTLPVDNSVVEQGSLLLVQGLADTGRADRARMEGEKFIALMPSSSLRAEVELVIGRAREQQGDWAGAIEGYDNWLSRFPTNALRARVEFQTAWASAKAGFETNALSRFTNFVAQYPTNDLAQHAQWWVADYYFRQDEPGLQEAEKNYKLLFQTWPGSPLAFDARMMAGRAAFGGQRYLGAIEHFTNVASDLKCPKSLRAQAQFAYGDALMSLPAAESNRLANYEFAREVFRGIPDRYPEEPVAILSWGELAKCWKQMGAAGASNAVFAFSQVTSATNATIAARSEAQVGIASVLMDSARIDLAQSEITEDQRGTLHRALTNLLSVVYGANLKGSETRDLFWVKRAALDAAPILEMLGDIEQSERLCLRMKELLPVQAAMWQRKVDQARERRAAEKNKPQI